MFIITDESKFFFLFFKVNVLQ